MTEFLSSLASLLGAGILLQDALRIQSRQGSGFDTIASMVLDSIKQGRPFATAIEEAGSLPDFVFCILRSGESSARLGDAVAQAAEWLKEDERIRGKIASALAYPLIVIMILEIALIFISSYCVPLARGIYTSLSAEAPEGFEISSILLTVTIITIAATLAFAIFAFVVPRFLKGSSQLKAALERFAERLPLVGKLITIRKLHRLCTIMASLLDSGMAIERALAVVAPLTGSSKLDRALREAQSRALRGLCIADAFEGKGVMGELRVWLGMAEAGADPAGTFLKLGRKLKDDFDRMSIKALALAEPILSASVGAMVVAAVALFVLPILGIYNELFG